MTSLLAGRTALVTGGSMGIGFGIAQVLASHGARVAVTGLTDSELVDASSHGFLTLTLDVRDRSQCAAAVDAVVAEFGELTILCSNAGIYPQATIAEMTEKDVYDIFSINVAGTINMVQAAQQALADTGRGRVVVTSSITGNYTGFPAWSHYGATKAAQMGFVRSAALELAEDKTTINAVMPGNVLTPASRRWARRTSSRWPPPCRWGTWVSRRTSARRWRSSPPTARVTSPASPLLLMVARFSRSLPTL